VKCYINGILMADKKIKAEGFCEALFFFIASLFGLGKRERRGEWVSGSKGKSDSLSERRKTKEQTASERKKWGRGKARGKGKHRARGELLKILFTFCNLYTVLSWAVQKIFPLFLYVGSGPLFHFFSSFFICFQIFIYFIFCGTL
jgi:hypothetical protein